MRCISERMDPNRIPPLPLPLREYEWHQHHTLLSQQHINAFIFLVERERYSPNIRNLFDVAPNKQQRYYPYKYFTSFASRFTSMCVCVCVCGRECVSSCFSFLFVFIVFIVRYGIIIVNVVFSSFFVSSLPHCLFLCLVLSRHFIIVHFSGIFSPILSCVYLDTLKLKYERQKINTHTHSLT